MNLFFAALERASLFGLVALMVALPFQVMLDGRVPASWRVWLWRVALGQTALAALPLTPLHLAVLPSRVVESMPLRPVTDSAPQFSPLPISPVETPIAGEPFAPLSAPILAPATPRHFSLRPFLLAFYGMGLVVQLASLARSAGRVRRKIRVCGLVETAEIHLQLHRIAREMRVSRLPHLLKCENGAPFLVSVFRPAIALPRPLLTPCNPDLEAVLRHELAHLQRRDLAWNAGLWLVQSLLWFHPLVWFARHFLSLETESACDEMVLSSTRIAPKSYGALLLNTMNHPNSLLTAGITDGFFTLKTRLVRLNRAPKRPRRAVQIAFVGALCVAVSASVPLRFVARAQDKAAQNKPSQSLAEMDFYEAIRHVPRDATPEAQIGLPADLKDARGNATISGRVVYENGKPAAGIRIGASCRWLGQTELWGYHRNEANKYRWPDKINKLLSGTAVTRADGTYRFTGLLPQKYRINLRNYGLNRAPVGLLAPYRGVGVRAVANQIRRAPDTVLRRSAQIRIRVVDQETGAPLEGVRWLGFIVNENGNKLTGQTVDAHQKGRPSKGFLSEGDTDKNGYCTLDLDSGTAYFYLSSGDNMITGQQDKTSQEWSGFPTLIITRQGLYKIETRCEVTPLSPASFSKPHRSWKGETEFQLKKGPAANFLVRLKRDQPLTPRYKSVLEMSKNFHR